MENVEKILSHFKLTGAIKEIKTITCGHINMTYRIIFEDNKQYTLQAINTFVFREPEKVMENILTVTRHVRQKLKAIGGDPDRESLTVVMTDDNKPLYRAEDGTYWRLYYFIDNARTYNVVENPIQMYNAGYGFGRFQKMLSDFDMSKLHETIPDFHNTKLRFSTLFAAAKENRAGRADSVREELAFFESRQEDAFVLANLLEQGLLPLRVTHNDTKVNNILIDDDTDQALCVIDLDTVMPGITALDFGDAIRFAANTAEEDETDLSKVGVDIGLYEEFTRGFLSAVGNDLTELELDYLPHGAKVITLEIAARFLTDYLNGDEYFKIHREHQNLDRTRCQIQLVRSMEEHFEEMCEIVKRCRIK